MNGFSQRPRPPGGGGGGQGSVGIPTVRSLIEPELCGKNERDARDGTKPMVYLHLKKLKSAVDL